MNTRNKMDPFRIAVLDLYQGEANQGMRGIQSIIESWSEQKGVRTQVDYFDVRIKKQIPDLSYDAYISSGGPGSPLDSRYEDWEPTCFTRSGKAYILYLLFLSISLPFFFNWSCLQKKIYIIRRIPSFSNRGGKTRSYIRRSKEPFLCC
jgi:hypothetical protein